VLKSRTSLTSWRRLEWWTTLREKAALAVRSQWNSLYRGLQGVFETTTRTIEGEAGIMWSLLLLALLVSAIVGRSP
jgi:hypothetical protein